MRNYLLGILACILLATACQPAEDDTLNPDCNSTVNPPTTGGEDLVVYLNCNKTGTWEIWKYDGTNEIQLTDDANFDFWWARVSPDETKFLCYRSPIGDNKEDNDYGRAELWIFDIDGSNGHKIIDLADNDWRSQGVADWHPSGDYLVMAAESRDPDFNNDYYWNFFITEADGSNPIRTNDRTGLFLDPSWSPDGTQIVYSAFPVGFTGVDLWLEKTEIHVADIDANFKMVNETRMTFDNFRDHDPYFSPDGSKIAFETITQLPNLQKILGEVAIRTVNTNDLSVFVVIDDGDIHTVPSWTADNQTIYYHRFTYSPLQGWHIAKINADGTGFEEVIKAGTHGYINPQVAYE